MHLNLFNLTLKVLKSTWDPTSKDSTFFVYAYQHKISYLFYLATLSCYQVGLNNLNIIAGSR